MDRLSSYPQDRRSRFSAEQRAERARQECGHRWLAYLEFRDGSRIRRRCSAATRRTGFFFDSDASHMEGNDIEDRGNGQFRTVGAVSGIRH
jgi:hypothetical protein